jgi:hypothetical protein
VVLSNGGHSEPAVERLGVEVLNVLNGGENKLG